MKKNTEKKSDKARTNMLKFLDESGFVKGNGDRIFDDQYYSEKEEQRLERNRIQREKYQQKSKEDRQDIIERQKKWNKENKEKCRGYENKYASINTRKRNAKYIARKIKCPEGMVRHHWSYMYDCLEDVIFLSREKHQFLHRYLEQGDNPYYYFTVTGLILDTREKHEAYMKIIFDFRDVVSDMINFLRKFDFSE